MKLAARRQRSDSASAAVAAAKAASLGPIEPPKHVALREGDRAFWNAIVGARARDTWNDSDLTTAANLARTQADIELIQAKLDAEGYVVEGKINPKAKLVETLSRRAVALSRVLHVHAEATQGRSRDAGKTLALEKQAAAAAGEHDDLIPTMGMMQ